MDAPAVSVVVPTRNRADYLATTLDSLLGQRCEETYELLVVDDGSSDATAEVAARAGARVVRHQESRGLNAARNTALRETSSPLVALVDDDVYVPPGWLSALCAGARRHPEAEVFGGPIRARFEGPSPRACGREDPPITTLDLGPADREVEEVWGANLALRRSSFERVGGFDESLDVNEGDETEWLIRLRAAGGHVVYLAEMALDHRRAGDDARLRSLARAAWFRGRGARKSDTRRGTAPPLHAELRVLAGCGWHTVRRACPQGLIMGAHSAGRLAETLRPGGGK